MTQQHGGGARARPSSHGECRAYNSIAEADGIATPIMDFWNVTDAGSMAATPISSPESDTGAYLRPGRTSRATSDSPARWRMRSTVLHPEGYRCRATLARRGAGRGQSGLAGRSRALLRRGRHSAAAKDHLCHSGLEKSAAADLWPRRALKPRSAVARMELLLMRERSSGLRKRFIRATSHAPAPFHLS